MRLVQPQSQCLYRVDRLPALILTFSLISCGTGKEEGAQATPPGRFVAVGAQQQKQKDPLEWCDHHWQGDQAPKMQLPPVVADQGELSGIQAGRWTWVNLWATWCGPCREEMPMLSRWDDQLEKDNVNIDLFFLSVDEDPALLAGYWKNNTTVMPDKTARLTDLQEMPPWLSKFQLGADTPIPIHVLVAPDGGARCVRAGSITDADFHTIKQILAKG